LLLHQSLRPLVPLVLKYQRSQGFEAGPKTLGQHLLKRRLEQSLTQAAVGRELGTDEWTVGNWEKGKTSPAVRYFPAIFRFLGYDPFPEPKTLPEKLLAKRRALGLSVKKAAMRAGADESTFARWERQAGEVTTYPTSASRFLAIT
jgi:transcriptional regulator with XRE-family HTH domain